jgi:hypothetical protein
MYEFLRNLFASEQPVMERFNVVDPTAVGSNVRSISLAYTPSTDQSSTSVVSLFWTDSKNKVYEKQFQDEMQAQNLYGSMKSDLQEAADLTRTEKMESAASLVRSLLKRYSIYTDELVDGSPAPITNTNASKKVKADELDDIDDTSKDVGSPEWIDQVLSQYEEENSRMGYIADQDDIMNHLMYVANEEGMGFNIDEKTLNQWIKEWASWKAQQKKSSLGKVAKVVMQNLFFETPEELQKYQEMNKKNQPGGKQLGDFKDDLPPMDKNKMPGEGLGEGLGEDQPEDGLAPSSLSYEDYEKNKAKESKSLTKRIEREVKDQVKSALERKVASTFDETDDELIDAFRTKGRTWEEIKNYFTKELQYDKDSVAAYIDALREAEHGGVPGQTPGQPPVKDPAAPAAPSAPKPPADLVSPETHDKLVKEVDDQTKPPAVEPPLEHEIEKHDMALGEIATQSVEIQKVAEEPLETIPKSRPEMGKDFDFLPDETNMSDDMKDDPAASPDPGDIMQVQEDEIVPGPDAKVYVMKDYQSGEGGYEGTLVGKFSSGGDEFGFVDVNGDIKDVPMRDIKRASEFRRLVKFAADRKRKREQEKARSAQAELRSIMAEIKGVDAELTKEAESKADANAWVRAWLNTDELESDPVIRKILENPSLDEKNITGALAKRVTEMLEEKGYSDYQIQNVSGVSIDVDYKQLYSILSNAQERANEEKENMASSLKEAAPAKLKCPHCGSTNVTPAFGHKLNKCDSCHWAFDNESVEDKEAASKNPYGFDPKDENVPCTQCGRKDLPLHPDNKCPNCSKYGKEKEAAPGDKVPKQTVSPADPKPAVEPEIKGPEMTKPWKKAPEGLREETPVLAPDIVNNLYNQVKDTEIKIQMLKTAADEIMKKAVDDARKVKEQGGEQALTEQYQVGIQKLYSALETLNAKVVEVDSTLLAYVKEQGKEEIKWTATEKLKAAIEKFPEITKYLENALNGAQAHAKPVEKRQIIPFPKAQSQQLSRFDKRADMMDIINYMLENVNAAYQALTGATGSEQSPQLAQ